jgi:hypothetical protein
MGFAERRAEGIRARRFGRQSDPTRRVIIYIVFFLKVDKRQEVERLWLCSEKD